MKTFTIDTDNNITAHASREAATNEAGERFSTPEELGEAAENWPGARLIEIWNSLPGVQPVRKFTSRQVAVRRIWIAIQTPAPASSEPTKAEPSRTAATRAHTKAGKASKADRPSKARSGTKTEQVIALLKQPNGVTLKAPIAATSWQPHSVRGFLSGQVAKKMGLRVKSFERNGERVYAIRWTITFALQRPGAICARLFVHSLSGPNNRSNLARCSSQSYSAVNFRILLSHTRWRPFTAGARNNSRS